MIRIRKSPSADTRTCDAKKVSKEELVNSTMMHISDVKKGLDFIISQINDRICDHDHTKLSKLDSFHKDFINNFHTTDWWDLHKTEERHHLLFPSVMQDGDDGVNLIDIMESIVDGVMAGMARSGNYVFRPLSDEMLQRAYKNTVKMLLKEVEVED